MSTSIKEFKEVFKNCKINEYGNIILPDTNQCLTCGRLPKDLLTVKKNYLLKNNKRLLKKIQNTLTGRNITENEMKDILSQAFILEKVDNTDTSSKKKIYRLSSLLHVGTYLINVKEDLTLCYPGNYSKGNNNVFNRPGVRHLTEDECRKVKHIENFVGGSNQTIEHFGRLEAFRREPGRFHEVMGGGDRKSNPLTCNSTKLPVVVASSKSDCTAKLKQKHAENPEEYLFGSYFDVRGNKICRYGTGNTVNKAQSCGAGQVNLSEWGPCASKDIYCSNMILNPDFSKMADAVYQEITDGGERNYAIADRVVVEVKKAQTVKEARAIVAKSQRDFIRWLADAVYQEITDGGKRNYAIADRVVVEVKKAQTVKEARAIVAKSQRDFIRWLADTAYQEFSDDRQGAYDEVDKAPTIKEARVAKLGYARKMILALADAAYKEFIDDRQGAYDEVTKGQTVKEANAIVNRLRAAVEAEKIRKKIRKKIRALADAAYKEFIDDRQGAYDEVDKARTENEALEIINKLRGAIPRKVTPRFANWGKTYDWPDGCFQEINTKDVYFAPSTYTNNRWPLLKGTKEKDKKNIISKAIQLCSTDKTASSSKCSIEFGKENCPPLIRRLVNKSNASKFIIQESDFSIQNIVVNKDDLEDTESKLYKFIESNNLSHSIIKENYYDSFIQYIKLNNLLLRDTKHSHKLDNQQFKMKMDSLLTLQKKNKKYPKLISNINKGVDVIRDEYEKNKDMIDNLQNKKQMNIRNSLLSLGTYHNTERVRYFIKVFSIIFSIVITLYFLYLCFKKKIPVSKSSMVLFLVILLLIILGIIFI
jgi:hypothetical protein